MTREEAYDTKISPLMTQIIAICKEHDIPAFASFQYNDDRDGDDEARHCTTVLPFAKCSSLIHKCAKVAKGDPPLVALTITSGGAP